MGVKVTDEMTPGTVALPHGWGHRGGWRLANEHGGVNVNLLASSEPEDLEPLAGMAFLNGIPVRVEALARARAARRSSTRVPRSDVSISSVPSIISARSRMLARPRCPGWIGAEGVAVDEAAAVVGHPQLELAPDAP